MMDRYETSREADISIEPEVCEVWSCLKYGERFSAGVANISSLDVLRKDFARQQRKPQHKADSRSKDAEAETFLSPFFR